MSKFFQIILFISLIFNLMVVSTLYAELRTETGAPLIEKQQKKFKCALTLAAILMVIDPVHLIYVGVSKIRDWYDQLPNTVVDIPPQFSDEIYEATKQLFPLNPTLVQKGIDQKNCYALSDVREKVFVQYDQQKRRIVLWFREWDSFRRKTINISRHMHSLVVKEAKDGSRHVKWIYHGEEGTSLKIKISNGGSIETLEALRTQTDINFAIELDGQGNLSGSGVNHYDTLEDWTCEYAYKEEYRCPFGKTCPPFKAR